jgi:hypothetical protein
VTNSNAVCGQFGTVVPARLALWQVSRSGMENAMDHDVVFRYIAETFPGVALTTSTEGIAASDTFVIDNPKGDVEPQHQMAFGTIVTKIYGDFDHYSQFNRPGVFRLDIGVGRETFTRLFDLPSIPLAAEGTVDAGYDYPALDRLLPHPVYAPRWSICVLNFSEVTFPTVRPLVAEAYQLAVNKLNRGRSARPG